MEPLSLEVAISDILLEEQRLEIQIQKKNKLLNRIRERKLWVDQQHEIVKMYGSSCMGCGISLIYNTSNITYFTGL
jgi:predicted  nucleic acid-binding Zn-ribbon protein